MRAWTYQEVKRKVERELDLTEEAFIDENEMMDYCNAAIDEAEAEILKIHEDYFLTSEPLELVSGTANYPLPTSTYAAKLRALVYSSGGRIYSIARVRGSAKYLDIAETNNSPSGSEDYRYFLSNAGTEDGFQINLVPPSREDGEVVTVWFIRNAERVTDASDVIDIPEFAQFIVTYMKAMCRAKENGGEMPADAAALVEQQRKLMIETLTQMVPDDDDTVEQDMSHYVEHN
jgi:hypothetical protein